jgi:two-component system sensor histidine kinase KdpD
VPLAEEAQQAQVQVATERLRSSLLSAVSHDLRTPLTAIAGAASGLLEEDMPLDTSTRRELCQTIAEEAYRLNRLVNNLLDMTRLEAGAVQVHKEWQPLEEVVGVALTRLEAPLHERPLTTHLPAGLLLVPLDGVLIEQVLINVLDNASNIRRPAAHCPVGGPLTTRLRRGGGPGPGLPPARSSGSLTSFTGCAHRRPPNGTGLG